MSAPAFCLAIDLNASSNSSDDLAIVGRTVRPKALAASWIVSTWRGWAGLSDMRTAMRVVFGTTACSNSTPLTCSSVSKLATPVILPPGRARLATYRVGGPDHDNRDGRRCTLGSDGPGGCLSDDGVGFQRNDLGGQA